MQHRDLALDGTVGPTSSTPAAVILAFRRRHCLTPEHLADMLDVPPETLLRYEELGAAPPWMAYALAGLGYEQFGVMPGGAGEAGASSAVEATFYLPSFVTGGPATVDLSR